MQARTLFNRLRSVFRVTQEILREARATKNHIIALQAIGRLERQLEFEARLLSELNDSAKVAAGIPVSQLPDVSHLTSEQLFAEQRILHECRERLEAVHAGKPDPLMIEAAAGSVEEVTGDEPTSQRCAAPILG